LGGFCGGIGSLILIYMFKERREEERERRINSYKRL